MYIRIYIYNDGVVDMCVWVLRGLYSVTPRRRRRMLITTRLREKERIKEGKKNNDLHANGSRHDRDARATTVYTV